MVGLGREGQVKGNDVAGREQLIERDVGDAVGCRPIGRLDRIEGENLHPEATKNLGDQTTDLPGADDAGGFAVQIETDETG